MSLLGKVLTILNALAAIAFLAIAALDYQARNQWTYAVFRHELAINGLPLDDKDDSWRPGRPIIRDISAKTADELFRAAGGSPVKTQLDAVKQARQTAMDFIESAGDETTKRTHIAAVWLPLIPHSYARENAVAAIRTRPVAELTAAVGGLFDTVVADIQGGSSVDFKRMRVADLLYNFNPGVDPQLRERAQAVLGLDAYVQAADRQARNLYGQLARLEQIVREDSDNFARLHQQLLPRLTLLNDQLKADKARLDQYRKALEQHNLLLAARTAERDELTAQLQKARAAAAAETQQLAAVQQQLFAIQREIADARDRNEKLEGQIRTRELGK